ncbi:MAG: SDR family NAD(P)-dependent oxidoreductase [Deferribacteraceae bacterium]|jgi:NADP-dependent 3-hydroxy acid dehydrogenase YdfG|nr:SDR family NAD(P)-dependent oxidoreductase [Deferribacteraceae bacterium]
MNRLKNKWALITGASSGIGQAVAMKLAEYDVNLILAARRVELMRQTAEKLENDYGIKIAVYELDVRDRQKVAEFGEALKKDGLVPDILINNAGLSAGKDRIHEANIDDWELMIDTNLNGLLYVSRAVIPMMVERNAGHIINLGSIAGEQVYQGGSVYNATKFGVKALSQAMNIDLAQTNIRICNIEPGAVNTEFSLVRFKGDKDKADSTYEGFRPLTAIDIADTIVYVLNLPEYVNVQRLLVTPTAQRTVDIFNRVK